MFIPGIFGTRDFNSLIIYPSDSFNAFFIVSFKRTSCSIRLNEEKPSLSLIEVISFFPLLVMVIIL